MNTLTLRQIDRLIEPHRDTCVSLYMPVSWDAGQWRQNETRLRHLLHDAETRLISRGLTAAAIRDFLEPVQQFVAEGQIWLPGHDGLALFLTRESVSRLPLRGAIAERLLVEERFLVTPLIPLLQRYEPFCLLAVSQNAVRFLRSDGIDVQEVQVPDLPASLAEACGHHPSEPVRVVHGSAPRGKSAGVAVHHGQGNLRDQTQMDRSRYLRLIQDALQPILQESPLPLLFAGVDDLFAIYTEVNTYPRLLEQHLSGNPERMTVEELHGKALSILAAHKQQEIERTILACTTASARMGGQSLPEVLVAAMAGVIDALVFDEQVQQWGAYDPVSQSIRLANSWEGGMEELVNRAVVETYRCRGQVYAAPSSQLKGNSIAAKYRYPLPAQKVELVHT